jgi:hypothetical protein
MSDYKKYKINKVRWIVNTYTNMKNGIVLNK